MGKNSSKAPDTPSYQQDPVFRQAFGNLAKNAQDMATLSLGGNPKLLETIQFHPEMLTTFLDTLKMKLTPEKDDAYTQMRNELAAGGSLTASTAPNAFKDIENRFLNTLQVQTGDYGLQTMAKALENRISIANIGMQGLGTASGVGLQAEKNLNDFNLQNYENQFGKYLYDEQNKAGGWLGALQGGLGGAAAGFAMGGPIGGLIGGIGGGASGYFSPTVGQGSGSNILSMGMAAAPMALKGGLNNVGTTFTGGATTSAGMTAGKPFDDLLNQRWSEGTLWRQ